MPADTSLSVETDRAVEGLAAALDATLAVAGRPGAPRFSAMVAVALRSVARRHGGPQGLADPWPGSREADHLQALGTEPDGEWW